MNRTILMFVVLMLASALWSAPDPFAAGVRPTEPLTPAKEAKSFHLASGFRIQLFASEPQINKPMKMAFDTRGRVWVSSTVEYPFPVKPGIKGRDALKILEDTNGDGHADKVTTFADGLNIPAGVNPYKDGAIVWSIPNIWLLRDTNGDGRADIHEVLYGPLSFERDTHGMNSSFTRSFDGWLHITHGFNNHTTVRASDGSSINMQSGHTYRVRVDRSRVEQFTGAKAAIEAFIRKAANKPTGELTEAGLEKVTELELAGNDLAYNKLTDVKGLEKLTQLSDLDLEDNPDLAKAQIIQLQQALPKCKILSTPTK